MFLPDAWSNLRPVEPDVKSLTPAAHTNDGFFKAIFSQPEHATAFFKSHLPPALTALIDWTTHTVLPGSFVKSSLQQVHSDLLFSVRIGKREMRLYLLFEHQSTPDPAMPLRLLYALHSVSDLDAKKIYHSLSTNPELEKNAISVAEKLKAEGRVEGLWIGKIQTLEEFLALEVSFDEILEALNLGELEALHQRLHNAYESRFKRH